MTCLDAFQTIVGSANIVSGEVLNKRPQDFWHKRESTALGLVKPGNRDELVAVISHCNNHGIPVTMEGGRTNLVEGTKADKTTLLVSLERMNYIGAPDERAMTIEVEAGAIIQNIQDRCSEAGLRFGLDFGARGSATIGGALSTNAGGFQAIRYGVARDQVLGLECVLADGTVLSHLVPYPKDNTGYDLKQLFIGSEGTLGIITKAILRLHPAPVTTNTALLAFDSFEAVSDCLSKMKRSLCGMLSSFEIMWRDFFQLNVNALYKERPPIELGHRYYVLCEAEGFTYDADDNLFETLISSFLEDGTALDGVIAQSSRQRSELWKIREDFEAEMAIFLTVGDFDISLPITAMEEFADRAESRLKAEISEYLGLHIFGHLGDGNLHVTIGLPTPEKLPALKALIYGLVAELKGSISAEHGIGLAKRDYLHHSRTPTELSVMAALKKTLDPNGILNPGKIVPKL